ncbi:MAG: hypothetical protein R3242_09230, partial [Akkermansiaceae bacterium]|nr:hypothetical protein [Akkermansiaceae bacterium]
EGLKKPKDAVIHSVATIDTESSPIFEGFDHPFVHLLYAFRHDASGMSDMQYAHRKKGVKITKLREKHPDPYWPYEEFPDILPKLPLECFENIEVDDDAIEMLLSQYVGHEDPDKIIAVVPPSSAYGVSLWGDMGDDEGVQCIFEISIKSGKVKTYNICS